MTKEQLLADVLNTALNDGYLNSTQHTELTAHIDALVADATMYRAMRAIATEPDAAIRHRMSVACDPIGPSPFFPDHNNPTNEQYDAFSLHLINVANGARNADG